MTIDTAPLDDYAVVIVNFPDNDQKYSEYVEEAIYFAKHKAKTLFNMDISVATGEIHKEIYGIHDSFIEAIEAVEYLTLLGEGEVIHYNEIKNSQSKYFYTIDMEQKIINSLKVGNQKSASMFIREVFRRNFEENNISLKLGKYLVYDMTSTIIKALDEIDDLAFLDGFDLTKNFMNKTSLQSIESDFIKIVEKVCIHTNKQNEIQDKNDDLSKEIIAYIAENYQDNNLNVSMIGLEFNRH